LSPDKTELAFYSLSGTFVVVYDT